MSRKCKGLVTLLVTGQDMIYEDPSRVRGYRNIYGPYQSGNMVGGAKTRSAPAVLLLRFNRSGAWVNLESCLDWWGPALGWGGRKLRVQPRSKGAITIRVPRPSRFSTLRSRAGAPHRGTNSPNIREWPTEDGGKEVQGSQLPSNNAMGGSLGAWRSFSSFENL